MNNLLSIIIPVYNVEKYLVECLESVINQDDYNNNLEIILVDDGSTDGSLQICKDYALKDQRIKVFSQKNKGVSEARNLGAIKSEGKYLTFIDSDDFIEKTYIKDLYEACKNNEADIVVGGYRYFRKGNPSQVSKHFTDIEIKIFSGYDIIKNIYNEVWGICNNISPCCRLIKRELVLNNPFPKGKFAEDLFTTYKYYLNASKIVYIKKILYNYRKRESSLMTSKYNLRYLDVLEGIENIIFEIDKLKIDNKFIIESYLKQILFNYKRIIKYNLKFDLKILENKFITASQKNKNLNSKYRILSFFIKIKVYRVYKKIKYSFQNSINKIIPNKLKK